MRTRTLLVAIPLALLAACGGDEDRSVPPGTSTPTSADSRPESTTTTAESAPDEESEIVERYTAFWDARFAANEEPVDPDAPALREYATGAQLDNVIAETTRNRDEGLAFRRPDPSVYERRVTVIEVDGAVARLHDCATNDGILYRVADGSIVDDSVATHSIEAEMRLVDGEWRLERASVLQRWEGVAGCALAE